MYILYICLYIWDSRKATIVGNHSLSILSFTYFWYYAVICYNASTINLIYKSSTLLISVLDRLRDRRSTNGLKCQHICNFNNRGTYSEPIAKKSMELNFEVCTELRVDIEKIVYRTPLFFSVLDLLIYLKKNFHISRSHNSVKKWPPRTPSSSIKALSCLTLPLEPTKFFFEATYRTP